MKGMQEKDDDDDDDRSDSVVLGGCIVERDRQGETRLGRDSWMGREKRD